MRGLAGWIFVGLMVLLWGAAPVAGQLRPGLYVDLKKLLEDKTKVRVDGGYGLTFNFVKKTGIHQTCSVIARNRLLGEEIEGFMQELLSFEFGPARYWILSIHTGGPHCCGEYHVFVQPDSQSPPRFLEKFGGHQDGPVRLREALVVHRGQLYFKCVESRFCYFHTGFASSHLILVPETFLKITPVGLRVDNFPFKAHFLAEAKKTDAEILKEVDSRSSRPVAILKYTQDFPLSEYIFSDDLGQLLVKRTIYLLYAREHQQAWESFARDVAAYYQSSRFVPELKAEILEILRQSPY